MFRPIFSGILALCALTACSGPQEESIATKRDNLFGLTLDYDLRPASLDETRRIMNEFSAAYVKRDQDGLKKVLSEDFVWYVHDGTDTARGAANQGVDGLLEVLNQRQTNWSDVAYSDIEFYASGDKVFQQFRVRGVDSEKGAFDTFGIDVYVIRDGKIVSKDSYWKRQPGS